MVETDLDHFAAVKMAKIVMQKIHDYLSFTVVLGWERPCLVVT